MKRCNRCNKRMMLRESVYNSLGKPIYYDYYLCNHCHNKTITGQEYARIQILHRFRILACLSITILFGFTLFMFCYLLFGFELPLFIKSIMFWVFTLSIVGYILGTKVYQSYIKAYYKKTTSKPYQKEKNLSKKRESIKIAS